MKFWKWDLSWSVILACAFAYTLNIFFSSGIYDHSDGLAHFAIARYAPKHPRLFLDHWGKPLFTLLSSPFTLFGIKGVMIFNTILYVFTARFLVLLGRNLNLRFLWSLPLLLAAIPVYYQVTMGGLTEVLFAAVLTMSLWFFADKRFMLSALLISFLMFARSEAYFVILFFACAFAFKREWLAIVMLLVGPLLLSSIGWFVLGDFWWIVHNNPYVGAVEIYGSGSLWHFFNHRDEIAGNWLFFGALVGVLFIGFSILRRGFSMRNTTLLLIAAIILSIFGAHSWFWYKGLYGSYGLLRVLATIAPLFVLLFAEPLAVIANKLINPKLLIPIPLLACFFTIQSLLAHQQIAKKPDDTEQKIQALAKWYGESKNANNPNVWFMYPAIGYYLGIDHFDKLNSRFLWYLDRIKPSNSIREEGLIIYDSGLSPNEGNTSIQQLEADPFLHLVYQAVNPVHQTQLRVYEKVFPKSCDTLVNENFSSPRPLLEGRLHAIGVDDNGNCYLKMANHTHYMRVFTFWRKEQECWQAPEFDFWYHADDDLQVYLSLVYEDGHEEDVPWHAGAFELPEFGAGVVNMSIALRNPNPEKTIKVYSWGLRKLDTSAI